ncbi:hypothetical protein RI534_12930 [Aeromonas allosaccharophila]|uniref:hypothetical protein n=1 Tax=Aeromonas allosaccharophila TaxID=656 RepID=UPI003444B782
MISAYAQTAGISVMPVEYIPFHHPFTGITPSRAKVNLYRRCHSFLGGHDTLRHVAIYVEWKIKLFEFGPLTTKHCLYDYGAFSHFRARL